MWEYGTSGRWRAHGLSYGIWGVTEHRERQASRSSCRKEARPHGYKWALRNTWPQDSFGEYKTKEMTEPAQSHSQGHHMVCCRTKISLWKGSLGFVNPRGEFFGFCFWNNSVQTCWPGILCHPEKVRFSSYYRAYAWSLCIPPKWKQDQDQISIYVILSPQYRWTQYNGCPSQHISGWPILQEIWHRPPSVSTSQVPTSKASTSHI